MFESLGLFGFYYFSGAAGFHLRTEPWFVAGFSYSGTCAQEGHREVWENGKDTNLEFILEKQVTTFPTI